jgi:hypothetical protein
LKFFVDRNIAPRIARILDQCDQDHEVRHHDDYFARTAPDVEWIGELGRQRGWCVIGGDARILRNPAEMQALRDAELTFFVLKSAWMSYSFIDQAWRLVKIWPEIVSNATRVREATIFEVPGSASKVERLRLTRE